MVCAVLACMLVSSAAAYAHPNRDFEDLEPFDVRLDPQRKARGRGRMRPPPPPLTPEQMCERNTSWPKLIKCLSKNGNKVKTLYDAGKGRVVSVEGNPSYGNAAVYLYTQKSGRWNRMGLYLATNATSELLGLHRLVHENGYVIEQGTVMRSSAFTGERFPGAPQTTVVVTLRRKTSSVCLDNGYCQTLVTSCDALVDGKTRWSFRGTLRIDHGQVRMSGDRTYAGQVCAPSISQLSDAGDILE